MRDKIKRKDIPNKIMNIKTQFSKETESEIELKK